MKRKLLSICISSLLLFQTVTFSASAVGGGEKDLPNSVRVIMNISGLSDVIEERKLLGPDDDVVGHCLEFDNGYLIYLNNGTVTEYSTENNSRYYGSDELAYYGGPLQYFTRDGDDDFVHVVTEQVISEDTLDYMSDMLFQVEQENQYNTENFYSQSVDYVMAGETPPSYLLLPYSPDAMVDFNSSSYADGIPGTCVAHAAEIMLLYYHRHTTGPHVYNANYLEYSRQARRNFLCYLIDNYYPPHWDSKNSCYSYAQSFDQVYTGLDDYFIDNKPAGWISPVNSTYTVMYDDNSPNSFLYNKIYKSVVTDKRPIIMVLYENEDPFVMSQWNINHAVVVWGIMNPFYYGQVHMAFYKVNDGWGHNDVNILDSPLYIRGLIGFSNKYSDYD